MAKYETAELALEALKELKETKGADGISIKTLIELVQDTSGELLNPPQDGVAVHFLQSGVYENTRAKDILFNGRFQL